MHENDHSLLAISEVKKKWKCTSMSPNALIAYTDINIFVLHERKKEVNGNGRNAFS
jgi:hypothetical protein